MISATAGMQPKPGVKEAHKRCYAYGLGSNPRARSRDGEEACQPGIVGQGVRSRQTLPAVAFTLGD